MERKGPKSGHQEKLFVHVVNNNQMSAFGSAIVLRCFPFYVAVDHELVTVPIVCSQICVSGKVRGTICEIISI